MASEIVRKVKSLIGNRLINKVVRFEEACKYANWRVWDKEEGNIAIKAALQSMEPQAIGKLGHTELRAIRSYLQFRNSLDWQKETALHRQSLYIYSGVYPDRPDIFKRYCEYMLDEILPEISIIGVWFNVGEAGIVKKYSLSADLIPTRSLETYYVQGRRWTSVLEGKKVLVMHPFLATIKKQFEMRRSIWPGKDSILPAFELIQLKVPQYPSLVSPKHPDWFASLEEMQHGMSMLDFDVALIGAGAYSLPLAVHAKKLGKQGIHLGGATQVYFGIKGGRWDTHPIISKFYNEYWTRPLSEDTPNRIETIENGCYW